MNTMIRILIIMAIGLLGSTCADALANLWEEEQNLFSDYSNGLDRSGFDYKCAISQKQSEVLGLDDPGANRGVEVWRRSDGAMLHYTITDLHPLALSSGEDTFIDTPLILSRVYYSGAGPDGVWFTGDDQKEGTIIRPDYANIDLEGFYSAGFDGEFFTGDDFLPSGYEKYIIDENGRLIEEHIYDLEGGDGDWYTSDDEYARQIFNDYYSSGLLKQRRNRNPEPDNSFLNNFTSTEFTYSNDLVIEERHSQLTNDVESGVQLYDLDYTAKGQIRRDEIEQFEYEYNSEGTFVRKIELQGDMETVDGYTDSYYENELSLFVSSSTEYTGPGVDGLWFTEDDVHTFTEGTYHNMGITPVYTLDGRLHRMAISFSRSAGVDGIWNTDDDDFAFDNNTFVTFGEDERYIGLYIATGTSLRHAVLYNKEKNRIDLYRIVYVGEDGLIDTEDDTELVAAGYGCTPRSDQADTE